MSDYIEVRFTFGQDGVLKLSYSNSGEDTSSFEILVHEVLSYAILKLDTTHVRKELRSIMFYRGYHTAKYWLKLIEMAKRLDWPDSAERSGALQKLTDSMWFIYLAALNGNRDCLEGKYKWFITADGKIRSSRIGSWTIIPSFMFKMDVCSPKMTCPSKGKRFCTSSTATLEDVLCIIFRALAVDFGAKSIQVREGKFAGIAECFKNDDGVVFFIVKLFDKIMTSVQEKSISAALKRVYIMPSVDLQDRNESYIIKSNNDYVRKGRKTIRTDAADDNDDDYDSDNDNNDDADVAVKDRFRIPIFNNDGSTNMLTIMITARNAAVVEFKACNVIASTLQVT